MVKDNLIEIARNFMIHVKRKKKKIKLIPTMLVFFFIL